MEREQIRDIRLWRNYNEASPVEGFRRFVSADPRFPVSILYPVSMLYTYDRLNENNLHLDWDGGPRQSISISKTELMREASNSPVTAEFVSGKIKFREWVEESFARKRDWLRKAEIPFPVYKLRYEDIWVGEEMDRAGRLVWCNEPGEYIGDSVCVVRIRYRGGRWKTFESDLLGLSDQQPTAWECFNRNCISEEEFQTVLSSWRWLDDDHFRKIDALLGG